MNLSARSSDSEAWSSEDGRVLDPSGSLAGWKPGGDSGEGMEVGPTRYQRWGKRLLDVSLGTVLAIVALPLILLLSIGSLIAFRAWPIFVQRRVGRGERSFRFPKIRSLPTHAPRSADKQELKAVATNRYGRFLRNTHLDELPQLLVVPFGRMSLVGPRPEMPELLDRYPGDVRAARASVLPGCTGLWQVSKAAGGQIYEAPEYDTYYVRHASFGLDARILGRTFRALLNGGRVKDLQPLLGSEIIGGGRSAVPTIAGSSE